MKKNFDLFFSNISRYDVLSIYKKLFSRSSLNEIPSGGSFCIFFVDFTVDDRIDDDFRKLFGDVDVFGFVSNDEVNDCKRFFDIGVDSLLSLEDNPCTRFTTKIICTLRAKKKTAFCNIFNIIFHRFGFLMINAISSLTYLFTHDFLCSVWKYRYLYWLELQGFHHSTGW